MKIIRIWFFDLRYCDYYYDRDWYYALTTDSDYTFLYSRDEAMSALHARAEEFRSEWPRTENHREYGANEVGDVWSILVPVKDGVDLPDDASDLIREDETADEGYTPLYLDTEHTDIVMEHEFPWIGRKYTLYEDGTIEDDGCDDNELPNNHPVIDLWRDRGWDGTIEEVIL